MADKESERAKESSSAAIKLHDEFVSSDQRIRGDFEV